MEVRRGLAQPALWIPTRLIGRPSLCTHARARALTQRATARPTLRSFRGRNNLSETHGLYSMSRQFSRHSICSGSSKLMKLHTYSHCRISAFISSDYGAMCGTNGMALIKL
eukprot:2691424-Pleurochrysis_carterae.AAC.1